LAESAPPLPLQGGNERQTEDGRGLKIAYLRDSAFTFYYPENLEALEGSGAELCPVSSLEASALPEDADALYIGGGFPETHASAISRNVSLLASIRQHALSGFPVYAECGGLMLLAKALLWKGTKFRMAGILPFEVEVCTKPQGHGYEVLVVDCPNPYYPIGARIRAHEFHYSRIIPAGELPSAVCAVQRGTGCFGHRDGIVVKNVWASYAHVHAAATPEWALGFLAQARNHRRQKTASSGLEHPEHTAPDTMSHPY